MNSSFFNLSKSVALSLTVSFFSVTWADEESSGESTVNLNPVKEEAPPAIPVSPSLEVDSVDLSLKATPAMYSVPVKLAPPGPARDPDDFSESPAPRKSQGLLPQLRRAFEGSTSLKSVFDLRRPYSAREIAHRPLPRSFFVEKRDLNDGWSLISIER